MSKEFLFGIIGFLVGIILTILVTTSAVNNNMTGIMGMMGIRSTFQDSNVLDAHFIEQMIPHHEDAITMAKLALEKSERSEIINLSNNIIASQSREIEQMRGWYKDWFGKDVPQDGQIMGMHGMRETSGMHMGMMGDETDIERLSASSDFDKTFIEEMIPHHQMAVMMATMLKNGTNRKEMKKLAEDIISAQTSEIDQMRQWYKEWGF